MCVCVLVMYISEGIKEWRQPCTVFLMLHEKKNKHIFLPLLFKDSSLKKKAEIQNSGLLPILHKRNMPIFVFKYKTCSDFIVATTGMDTQILCEQYIVCTKGTVI